MAVHFWLTLPKDYLVKCRIDTFTCNRDASAIHFGWIRGKVFYTVNAWFYIKRKDKKKVENNSLFFTNMKEYKEYMVGVSSDYRNTSVKVDLVFDSIAVREELVKVQKFTLEQLVSVESVNYEIYPMLQTLKETEEELWF